MGQHESNRKAVNKRAAKPVNSRRDASPIKTIALAVAVLILAGCVAVFGSGTIVFRLAPDSVRQIVLRTFTDTMTLRNIPSIFLSNEEISALNSTEKDDTTEEDYPYETREEGLVAVEPVSADEEVIEIIDIKGSTWKGKMMLVHDPSLIKVGLIGFYKTGTQSGFGTIDQFVEKNGAIGGVNASGFYNTGGPFGFIISEGELNFSYERFKEYSFVGFDKDNIMHVGSICSDDAVKAGYEWALCWKPILIKDGEQMKNLGGGYNPRTAIGQRSDGTVLLAVIEGRSFSSFGATYDDLASLMSSYGAVNAINLDSGASSVMYYDGEIITNVAIGSDSIGGRTIPNAIIVMPPET